jgi:glutathione-regulated potassium-efflux system ancillary protein KefC
MTSALGVAAAILLAACVAVPLAQKLRMSSVLAYLIAGAILGPAVLGVVQSPQDILHISEFGVVLFMFLIGLELHLSRLWEMRGQILGLGTLQVGACWAGLTGLLLLAGFEALPAAVAGFGLALSSTAVALQVFSERNLLPTPGGRLGFSILLYQDLAVIPVLVALPLLGAGSKAPSEPAPQVLPEAAVGGLGLELSGFWESALSLVAVVVALVLGRLFIRPMFRLIAATRTREIFTAFSLLIIVAVSLGMVAAGLSMALGAFVAGVLLSDSEYRHELEANIEPFKGLLLGLFFLSVGMNMDFATLGAKWGLVLGLLSAVVAFKIVTITALLRVYRLPLVDAIQIGVMLSQVGEFAFVLFSLGAESGILTPESQSVLNGVVALSMLSTSLLVVGVDRFVRRLNSRAEQTAEHRVDNDHPEVLVAGFGRFGQIAARFLRAHGLRTTLIDHSADVVESVRRFKIKAYYGDATRLDLLHAAGLSTARVLVIALDDAKKATQLAELCTRHFPKVKVVVRAYDLIHAYELLDAGVSTFERETFDSALAVGKQALRALGFGAFQVEQAAVRFKQHDVDTMHRLHSMRGNETEYFSRAIEAREEIERMLATDHEDGLDRAEAGWQPEHQDQQRP